MLTKKQKTAYIQNVKRCDTRCPYCGTGNIEEVDPMVFDSDEAYQEVICLKCRERWFNVYKLVEITTEK